MKHWVTGQQFPPTHWSAIGRAGQADTPEGLAAMDALIHRYYPALEAHLVYRHGQSPEAARDILQDFAAEKLLRKNLFAKADQRRGLFRTFLLSALNHFYLNRLRAEQARRRTPVNGLVSIEELEGFDPAQVNRGGNAAYDEAWALRVMETTLERMREECRLAERTDIFAVFEGRMLKPLLDAQPPVEFEVLVAEFGYESVAQASNVLVTAKRMFARLLSGVVAEYVASEEDVAEEIESLKIILSQIRAWRRPEPGIKIC
jgi:RNA polymerase sigma-70 factor (ECF subfamily)